MNTIARLTATSLGPVTSLLLLSAFTQTADAQLTPDRMYMGVDRPIPMTVVRPSGTEGDLSIQLLAAGTAEVISTQPVKEGPVNLAAIFPDLWKAKTKPLVYAQLAAGDKRLGPAVVVQPMEGPRVAVLEDNYVRWVPSADRSFTGYRCYVDKVAIVETTAGEIRFIMRPEVAPNTCFNFLHLAENGFYTDILIHRIVPKRPDGAPFVIQFGDPAGTGSGSPGYAIDLERSTLPHNYGVLSMARSKDPNSNGSQVFVCLSREGTQSLDGSYCAFAQAISGAETITALTETPVDRDGRPTTDPAPLVKTVRVMDAPPYGTAPAPIQRPAPAATPEPAAR